MWELYLHDRFDREYMGDADLNQRPEIGIALSETEMIEEIIEVDEESMTAKVVVGYVD